MRVRRLDDKHDWTFGSGLSNYAIDGEATRQCIITILLSFRFDWFLDEDHGINWFAYFVKNPNIKVMENDIKRHILNVDGVDELIELRLDLDTITREMIVTVRYNDIFGTTQEINQNVRNY